jgi:Na+-translocating ferredoxin:NAD+ oxidoreductase subunit B
MRRQSSPFTRRGDDAVHVDIYEKLAEALDRLPTRFPRTPSGVELPLLRKLYTPEQARLAAVMGREFETIAAIAERAGVTEAEAAEALPVMAANRMVKSRPVEAADAAGSAAPATPGVRPWYRLLGFVPGSYEGMMAALDDEFAGLFEAYMADGGARIIMGSSPPIARVAPNAAAVGRAEWILPYDDVRAIIAQAGSVVLSDCTCRLERAKVGEPCRFPLHVCLDLHAEERPDRAGAISKEEALAVLDESEKAGLVHCVSNVAGGWDWVCNCCGCCCEFLRGMNDWQVDRAVVRNYRAVVDAGACTGCGVCEQRCQVAAIAVAGESAATPRVAVVDEPRCIGCGLCVSACPEEAVVLERLPEAVVTLPPADWDAWEDERLGPT